MNLTIASDPEQVALAAADAIAGVVTGRPAAVLALPTGTTPVPVYAELADRRARGTVSLEHCTIFLLDEYLGIGADHPRSFRGFADEHLVEGLGVPADHLHSLDGLSADPDAECARYEDAIAEAGGLDLAVLGVGTNGHIAFNEPGSDPSSRTRVVQLTADTVGTKADGSEAPSLAMTIGVATITDARRILVVATGATKASAIAALVGGPATAEVPVSLLEQHPQVDVVVDPAAASKLSPT